MWPEKETIRKYARTFASQIYLLEKYPQYVFGASQPQHYPGLYEKIKRFVKEGRWEIQGAMWVEADCNLISGESMVRQILHGKNFFKDEFNIDVKNLWLPDVFGYSAAMPQILKKSGIMWKSKIGKSSIIQKVFLSAKSKRLYFVTKVDWKETPRMLRVSFPTTIVTSEYTSDIQYGFLKRPNHSNTSWDMAEFETPAHRYADLSDSGYGVALLNYCKYGYRVYGNTLDLNLLRSPRLQGLGNRIFLAD
jgi:alpha-mannosidase